MHQIKIFQHFSGLEAENDINKWLKDQGDLLVISINTMAIPYDGPSPNGNRYIIIITVVYEE